MCLSVLSMTKCQVSRVLFNQFLNGLSLIGNIVAGVACTRSEVSLFLFPMINLMSSPSRTVKQSVSQLIILLESLFVSHSTTKRDEPSLTSLSDELHVQRDSMYVSKFGTIIFRLLQHLWLQVFFFFLQIYVSSLVYFQF